MKRDTAATIFRTVVFAGAMLGTSACTKKPAPTTPTNTATEPAKTGDPAMMQGDQAKPATQASDDPCAGADPCADPCAGDPCGGERPRGTDADGGGGEGRGFILS
jgi:hypothetical protein